MDFERHKTNVIKPRLNHPENKTPKGSKPRMLDIAESLRKDARSFSEEEVNFTTSGKGIVKKAQKGIHEVLVTEIYYGDKVLVTDAARDLGLLMPDTASDNTVGTACYLDRYEKEVLNPLGLLSVSQPEE